MNRLNRNAGWRQFSKPAGAYLGLLGCIVLWLTPAMLFARIAQDLPQDARENSTSGAQMSQSSNARIVASPENRLGAEKGLEIIEHDYSDIKKRPAQKQQDSWNDSPKLEFDELRGNERVQSIHQRIELLKEILKKQQSAAEANQQKAGGINLRKVPAITPGSVPAAELNPPEPNPANEPVSTQPQIEIPQPPAVEQDTRIATKRIHCLAGFRYLPIPSTHSNWPTACLRPEAMSRR